MSRHLGKHAAETSTTKHSLRKHAKVTTSSYEQQRGEYNEARDVRITTNGDEITLDELHRSPNGGWFTIKSTVTIAHVDLRRYLYRRCVECRKKAIQNAEGKYCCVEHPEADKKQTYCLRVLLKQDDMRACAYHVNKYEHRYRTQCLIVYCVFGWIINKLCCDCCVCYFVYIYSVTVMARTRTLTNNITSGRNKRNEHHHHQHFLFGSPIQSNTRQSFATKSVVNKRVNACIETLRQRSNKKATQY